ncbi:MAG TPA: site-specific integrase, partial [Acidimicrobiales bacterium]|nr:site-specific integrase [Acidimicrobiales bacterium]
RRLAVTETVAEVGGRLVTAPVKTAASRRTLSLPPFLLSILAEHLQRTGRTDPTDLVLQAPGGGPMRAANFRTRVWRPAVTAAGLDGLTFHGLRHTAAGLMIEVGAHIEAIKQRMGHSSIRVTSDVYGSLLPSVDESVTRDVERLFSASRGLIADSGGGDAGQL